MKLFMVHVGFYDEEIGEGIYESHVNFFVAAGNAKSAKKKTFQMEKFKNKKCILMVLKRFLVLMDMRCLLSKIINTRNQELLLMMNQKNYNYLLKLLEKIR